MRRDAYEQSGIVRAGWRAARRCREERGITRHDLAAQMGVTPYWLSLVESAERPMTVEYLLRVCPVLGMDLRMLKAG